MSFEKVDKSEVLQNFSSLQKFFCGAKPPLPCDTKLLADSTFRNGFLELIKSKSNGACEYLLVTLDGAQISCRRLHNSQVKLKILITSSTLIKQVSSCCFSLENDGGNSLEFNAVSEDICLSWTQSIRANRAWVAQQEYEQDEEDWQDCSTNELSARDGRRKVQRQKFLAGSLPTQGCSFSDTPQALLRGWNFCSETSQADAYDNSAQQFEVLIQGIHWPLDLEAVDNFEACYVQVALQQYNTPSGEGQPQREKKRRLLARTLPVPLCQHPQFPEALLLELMRADFDFGRLEFSVFLVSNLSSSTNHAEGSPMQLARFSIELSRVMSLRGNSAFMLQSQNWDGCLQIALLQPLYTHWPMMRGRWRMAQYYRVGNVLAREETLETIYTFLIPLKYMSLRYLEMQKCYDKRLNDAQKQTRARKNAQSKKSILNDEIVSLDSQDKTLAMAAAAAMGELSMSEELHMAVSRSESTTRANHLRSYLERFSNAIRDRYAAGVKLCAESYNQRSTPGRTSKEKQPIDRQCVPINLHLQLFKIFDIGKGLSNRRHVKSTVLCEVLTNQNKNRMKFDSSESRSSKNDKKSTEALNKITTVPDLPTVSDIDLLNNSQDIVLSSVPETDAESTTESQRRDPHNNDDANNTVGTPNSASVLMPQEQHHNNSSNQSTSMKLTSGNSNIDDDADNQHNTQKSNSSTSIGGHGNDSVMRSDSNQITSLEPQQQYSTVTWGAPCSHYDGFSKHGGGASLIHKQLRDLSKKIARKDDEVRQMEQSLMCIGHDCKERRQEISKKQKIFDGVHDSINYLHGVGRHAKSAKPKLSSGSGIGMHHTAPSKIRLHFKGWITKKKLFGRSVRYCLLKRGMLRLYKKNPDLYLNEKSTFETSIEGFRVEGPPDTGTKRGLSSTCIQNRSNTSFTEKQSNKEPNIRQNAPVVGSGIGTQSVNGIPSSGIGMMRRQTVIVKDNNDSSGMDSTDPKPLRQCTEEELTFKLLHKSKPRSTLQLIAADYDGLTQWTGPIARALDELIMESANLERTGAELLKLEEMLQRHENRYIQKETELVQLRGARDQLFWEREAKVLDLQIREDNNVSQALTATVVAFLSYLNELVSMGDKGLAYMIALAKCGFLIHQECLLSTHGKEKGMLEDQRGATGKLRGFVFQLARSNLNRRTYSESVRDSVSNQIEIIRTDQPVPHCAEYQVPGSNPDESLEDFTVKLVRIRLLPELFDKLVPELRDGHWINLYPVLFAQGINEFQSYQNALGTSAALQKAVNQEALCILSIYYRLWKECMSKYVFELEKAVSGIQAAHKCISVLGAAATLRLQSTLTLVCPTDSKTGDRVTIRLKNGQSYAAIVPEGVRPGDKFRVSFGKHNITSTSVLLGQGRKTSTISDTSGAYNKADNKGLSTHASNNIMSHCVTERVIRPMSDSVKQVESGRDTTDEMAALIANRAAQADEATAALDEAVARVANVHTAMSDDEENVGEEVVTYSKVAKVDLDAPANTEHAEVVSIEAANSVRDDHRNTNGSDNTTVIMQRMESPGEKDMKKDGVQTHNNTSSDNACQSRATTSQKNESVASEESTAAEITRKLWDLSEHKRAIKNVSLVTQRVLKHAWIVIHELQNSVEDEAVSAESTKRYEVLILSSDVARLLGGGRLTNCKSGKDRTGMSVTLEQARMLVLPRAPRETQPLQLWLQNSHNVRSSSVTNDTRRMIKNATQETPPRLSAIVGSAKTKLKAMQLLKQSQTTRTVLLDPSICWRVKLLRLRLRGKELFKSAGRSRTEARITVQYIRETPGNHTDTTVAGVYEEHILFKKTVAVTQTGCDVKNANEPFMDIGDLGLPVHITVADIAPYMPDNRTTWRHLMCESAPRHHYFKVTIQLGPHCIGSMTHDLLSPSVFDKSNKRALPTLVRKTADGKLSVGNVIKVRSHEVGIELNLGRTQENSAALAIREAAQHHQVADTAVSNPRDTSNSNLVKSWKVTAQLDLQLEGWLMKGRVDTSADHNAEHQKTRKLVYFRTRQEVAGGQEVIRLASVMRSKGVRIHNCRKNTGKAKFAFNSISRKMLPTPYKPPKMIASGSIDT